MDLPHNFIRLTGHTENQKGIKIRNCCFIFYSWSANNSASFASCTLITAYTFTVLQLQVLKCHISYKIMVPLYYASCW